MNKKYINRITKLLKEGEPNSDSLRKKCIRITFDELRPKDDLELKMFLRDLHNYGCQCGMVHCMINYTNTEKFFNENKDDINIMLYEDMRDSGIYDLSEMFSNNWDKEDPLCINTLNMNLMAYYAYEETMYKIANEIGLENL